MALPLLYFLKGVTDRIPDLPDRIVALTDTRVRFTRLGHAQRGGPVSHGDRRLATEMAYLAYEAFRDDVSCGAIVVQNGVTRLHQGAFGVQTKAKPDVERYRWVNGL